MMPETRVEGIPVWSLVRMAYQMGHTYGQDAYHYQFQANILTDLYTFEKALPYNATLPITYDIVWAFHVPIALK